MNAARDDAGPCSHNVVCELIRVGATLEVTGEQDRANLTLLTLRTNLSVTLVTPDAVKQRSDTVLAKRKLKHL